MKQAREIYEEMLATLHEHTDTALGDDSDLAVRLYAAAAQIESLYAYGEWVLAQSFPQTAVGEALDRHAAVRGLSRKGETYAEGAVTFSCREARSADLTVAEGTAAATPTGVRFETTEAGVIRAGETECTVRARAAVAGKSGNVGAGQVTVMPLMPVGVSGCTNEAAFSGGSDEEDDESLRARVMESFVRLPNGANAAFYEQCVKDYPGVSGWQVMPKKRGIGTVDVAVCAAREEDDALLAEKVGQMLGEKREIAVDVAVFPAERTEVDVAMTLYPAEGVAFETASDNVHAAVERLFSGLKVGGTLYPAQLVGCAMATGMLKNCIVTSPAAAPAAEDGVLPTAGEIELTEGT